MLVTRLPYITAGRRAVIKGTFAIPAAPAGPR